jgi:hypothetical protein
MKKKRGITGFQTGQRSSPDNAVETGTAPEPVQKVSLITEEKE